MDGLSEGMLYARLMRCIVTAGPTFEPLDEVRRLTNFSTGRLGSELADALAADGHEVVLLLGQMATFHGEPKVHRVEMFTTGADLQGRLQALAKSSVGAVFHAAAVGDFAFGAVFASSPEGELRRLRSGKFSSREGTLLAELVPTPKLIGNLREWYPRALLVGWKYEVEGEQARVLAAAESQMTESRTDACVANGPGYGGGFALVTKDGQSRHLPESKDLYAALRQLLQQGKDANQR